MRYETRLKVLTSITESGLVVRENVLTSQVGSVTVAIRWGTRWQLMTGEDCVEDQEQHERAMEMVGLCYYPEDFVEQLACKLGHKTFLVAKKSAAGD